MRRLRLAWLRLTGCAGCQLSLLNAESALAAAARQLELVFMPLLSSDPDDNGDLEVALVEGAVSTPEELQQLLTLRRRTPVLIAVGACALSGGVPALAGDRRGERFAYVYGHDKSCRSFPPQPLSSFVQVDLELPGCPPEPAELLGALGSTTRHGLPECDSYPVCFECRLQEQRCLLFETSPRQACLGAVTRAGCGANCPVLGIACEGCRGRLAEPHEEQLRSLLHEIGLSQGEITARLKRFGEQRR